MDTQDNNKDYDAEPVVYCARCYSLKIKYEEDIDTDCCMDCGCTDTRTSSIGEWERNYERRYGKKHIERSNDPRSSYLFKLTIGELKTKVYNSSHWREIIHRIYPSFPKGLSKADSIILLFDRLCKDRKIDDLRIVLKRFND